MERGLGADDDCRDGVCVIMSPTTMATVSGVCVSCQVDNMTCLPLRNNTITTAGMCDDP